MNYAEKETTRKIDSARTTLKIVHNLKSLQRNLEMDSRKRTNKLNVKWCTLIRAFMERGGVT